MNKIFNWPLRASFSPSIFKLLPATANSKKDQHIETLRGLAIILVVFGHMIGSTGTGGMRVSDDSIFRYLYYSLEYIRLPLFTVISGWVYANKPVAGTDQSKFIAGKFRRLIIPMWVLSTLLFVFRMIVPGTNTTPHISDLPRNLILPYDVYWYLFSLFLIFCLIIILDTLPVFHTFRGWLVAFICSMAFLFISENFLEAIPNFFSFKGAAYLFPFFLLGIGTFRFKEFLFDSKVTVTVLLVFGASILLQQMAWFGYFAMQEKNGWLGMAVGISGVLLLFRVRLKNNLLLRIGNYAYGIFLFHVFFTGGSRIALLKLGIANPWAILAAGVFCAILISIMLETLISQSNILRLYFLGLKIRKPQRSIS